MTTNIGGTLAVFGANSDHRGESNQSRRPPRESYLNDSQLHVIRSGQNL